MVRAIGSIGCVVLALVTGLVTAQGVIPPELAAMADTEREFAKTATSKAGAMRSWTSLPTMRSRSGER